MSGRFSFWALALGAIGYATGGAAAAEADAVLFSQPYQYDAGVAEAAYAGADRSVSGFIEGSYRHGTGEAEGLEADGSAWALRGAINARLDRTWNIQLDGLYSRTEVENTDIDALVGAAHAYYRVPGSYAVGAFVQGSRLDSSVLDLLAPYGLDSHATDLVGGAEAAVFLDRVTILGQLGFGQLSYSGFEVDHLMARAGARFYATDNIRFDVEGALNRFNAYGGEVSVYSLSAIGNYRFEQQPVTAFGGYRYDRADAEAGGVSLASGDAHSLLVGARFHFGSDSLMDEERNGTLWSSPELGL